jgi:hypothetical protein
VFLVGPPAGGAGIARPPGAVLATSAVAHRPGPGFLGHPEATAAAEIAGLSFAAPDGVATTLCRCGVRSIFVGGDAIDANSDLLDVRTCEPVQRVPTCARRDARLWVERRRALLGRAPVRKLENKKALQFRVWSAFPRTTGAILAPRYGGDPGAAAAQGSLEGVSYIP